MCDANERSYVALRLRSVSRCWYHPSSTFWQQLTVGSASMTNASETQVAVHRSGAGLFVTLASFLLSLVISHNAHAAGCGHSTQSTFDYDASRITVIYDGGNFYYYDNLQPCSGPNCGHSSPSSMDSAPAVLIEQRSNTVPASEGYRWELQLRPTTLRLPLQPIYLSPSYDELLRPPVAI